MLQIVSLLHKQPFFTAFCLKLKFTFFSNRFEQRVFTACECEWSEAQHIECETCLESDGAEDELKLLRFFQTLTSGVTSCV